MSVLVFDTETTIASEHHGPAAKDPINDFHTLIFGQHEDNIIVEHRAEGFKRKPSERFWELLLKSDILVGHNLSFDLPYIWHCPEFKEWLINGVRS